MKYKENFCTATTEELREEYSKIWDTSDMVNYCVKSTAICVKLDSGEMIPIEKQKIKTHFCFGESGYDYEEAVGAASYARTHEDYFIKENMERFGSMLQSIEDHIHLSGNYLMTIASKYTEKSKICCIRFEKLSKILDDLGGSANLESLKLGQEIIENGSGRRYRILTDEEATTILDAYKYVACAHRKKVDSYLKRYGLSKVHSWTYWRDA